MAEIVKMPKLSDTMTEGVVAKWHKKVGDKVKNGEILADIETDKATMEFESFFDGELLHVGVEEGKAVPIDALLAIIGKKGEDISGLINQTSSNGGVQAKSNEIKKETTTSANGTAKAPEIPATVNIIRMPKLSDTMTEGVVAKWHKKVGDMVKNGELLADIETDKATMEFESFYDGKLLYTGVQEGQAAAIDSILAIVGKGGEDIQAIIDWEKSGQKSGDITKTEVEKTTSLPKQTVAETKSSASHSGDRIIASPLAKMLAKEKGIDLSKVSGSGDNGRIIKKDIESYTPGSTQVAGKATTQTNYVIGQESFHEEAVSQMRKTIARRLTESKNGAPHFYLTMEIDMDNCIAARTAMNQVSEAKISYNDIVIKACAAALRKHPKVNASWMGDKIRFNHHIHIGMAVALEDGLVVPVIRFADNKSLSQISSDAKSLGKMAKEKKLQPADWEGNTFTVSNLGMFGIDEFTSIINSPEACILAVGGIKAVPVVKNGQIVPGNIMKITLSCDHRVVDGATGAAFLQTLKAFLENPVTILV